MPAVLPRLRHTLIGWTPVLLPLGVLLVMAMLNPTLRNPGTWPRMSRNWCDVALLAIALTPVIITGGIDLSVGSIVGLSAVAAGFFWRDLHWPLATALVGGVLTGAAAGFVNGSLVVARVNPLVVTLATLAVFRGLAYGLSGPQAVTDFPEFLRHWWDGSTLGLPHPVWVVLGCGMGVYVLLHHTWMGRMLFALGDNAAAARYAAVPVVPLTLGLYTLCGLLAGLAGLTCICRFQSAPADQGEGLELQAVACVILGGVRITGGAGHLAGTLLGVLTLAALLEGMVRIQGSWRAVILGVFLVAIVLLHEGLSRWRGRWQALQLP